MDRECRNYLRREHARAEREHRERVEDLRRHRAAAEREAFGPALLAASPVTLTFVYKNDSSGVRAEVVGLGLACAASTAGEAKRGLVKMIKDMARHAPREVLAAVELEAHAEFVTIDLRDARARARPPRFGKRA